MTAKARWANLVTASDNLGRRGVADHVAGVFDHAEFGVRKFAGEPRRLVVASAPMARRLEGRTARSAANRSRKASVTFAGARLKPPSGAPALGGACDAAGKLC
ncbi:MAG TPA: hypothetical protein VGH03_22810 [Caulobacteraceae bacterium]